MPVDAGSGWCGRSLDDGCEGRSWWGGWYTGLRRWSHQVMVMVDIWWRWWRVDRCKHVCWVPWWAWCRGRCCKLLADRHKFHSWGNATIRRLSVGGDVPLFGHGSDVISLLLETVRVRRYDFQRRNCFEPADRVLKCPRGRYIIEIWNKQK